MKSIFQYTGNYNLYRTKRYRKKKSDPTMYTKIQKLQMSDPAM